ncbi:hypothetical protein [Sinimarinibacterium flocculans]|uniref:Uncharacterized protein n=1 Tax=Sinimarinibacterium flocculans TaxID=985250 RepID=A0A318EBE1_9GAMM|nr:hypothetical protein [Sinimarinibacterium flocculans]PXV67078.1 hypothetical protein C8D93_10654 [Sinimarinibacterium flocculans]
MTKPRITASMLRKRPKPAEPETAPQAETAAEETEDSFAGQPAQAGSMLDNPSFRAPQFGIKPRVGTQSTVRVHHSGKRRYESA